MKKNIKKNGFSFVEVLITLAILFLSLTTISVLVAKSIHTSGEAQNQIIATGLAEEGIELVRNFKDKNPAFKSDGIEKPSGNYIVDKDTSYSSFIISASSGLLYLNSNGFYVHSATGNTPTKFYRKIVISNDSGSSKQVNATSYVSWNSTGSFSNCTFANKCLLINSILPDSQ